MADTDPVSVLAPPPHLVVATSCADASAVAEGDLQRPKPGAAQERYAVEQYDQRNCPICLEAYTPENPAVVYGCGHAYHLQCAEGWRLQSGEDACCMCGADIHGLAATAEPVVLNSAATPNRSPAKHAEAKADGADGTLPPPLAAAAVGGPTRAILPSSQSLDGLAHIAAPQAVRAHPHDADPAEHESLFQTHRRHRHARHPSSSPGGPVEDEVTPLTPAVDADRPRSHRRRVAGRAGLGGSPSQRLSLPPAPGARATRRDEGASSDHPADSPTADPRGAFVVDGNSGGAWAVVRRLVCCCFPSAGLRAEAVVEAASPDPAEARPIVTDACASSRRASYFAVGSHRTRRVAGPPQPGGDDDDGFVMVPTPSHSDADDESGLAVTTDVRPPRHHHLARGWPE